VPDAVSAATTSILDGGGVLGAWWRVSAVTAKGSGPPSGSIRVTPRFGPHVPEGLTAATSPAAGVGSGQVKLSWGYSPLIGEEEITGYFVEWSVDGTTWTTVPVDAAARSYTVDGLANFTPHRFRVRARNVIGVSPPSEIQATPLLVPDAPAGLRATLAPFGGLDPGQVRLSWAAPTAPIETPVTDYLIEFSADGSTWTRVNDGVSTATTHTMGGLVNDTEYSFRVAARNAHANGAWSPAITATPRWGPGTPVGLAAAVAPTAGMGSEQVKLTWNAPASDWLPIVDYVIEASVDGTTWTTVNDGVSTATTYTVSGLTNGTQYSYRVAARNAFLTGAWTPAITAMPAWVPGAPGGLTTAVAPTAGVGSGQVKLTWTAAASNGAAITDYVIESSVDEGTTWTTVNDGVSPATSYTVSGLTNGTQYSFRVAAKNAVASGAWTAAVLATPLGAPGAPGGLTAAAAPAAGVGSGQVKLTWSAPASNGAAITDYVIESSADGGATWTTVNDGVSTATTTMVSHLTNGTQYSFRVAAKNAVGRGAWSPAVLAKPLGAPGAPSGLTAAVAPAAGVGSGQVKLTWNPSADNGLAITDYVIESSLDGTTWTTVNDGVSTETTYTVSGLTNGTLYSFRVAGRNAIWISPRSPAIQARPAWADGALVKEQTRSEVYVIFGGAKFHLPFPFWVDRYGGWSNVTVVPDGALATVGTMPREGSVLREWSATAVYLIKNGQKCHITTGTILERYGGWAAVRLVPDLGLFLIPTGPPITS
jgi:titin